MTDQNNSELERVRANIHAMIETFEHGFIDALCNTVASLEIENSRLRYELDNANGVIANLRNQVNELQLENAKRWLANEGKQRETRAWWKAHYKGRLIEGIKELRFSLPGMTLFEAKNYMEDVL